MTNDRYRLPHTSCGIECQRNYDLIPIQRRIFIKHRHAAKMFQIRDIANVWPMNCTKSRQVRTKFRICSYIIHSLTKAISHTKNMIQLISNPKNFHYEYNSNHDKLPIIHVEQLNRG